MSTSSVLGSTVGSPIDNVMQGVSDVADGGQAIQQGVNNLPASAPPQQPAAGAAQGPAAQPPQQPPSAPPAKPTSRLGAIVSAVSNAINTGLAGIPDRGRPSFFSGLGEGARSEQQAQATAQAIKFKTFDDSLRAAQLHNQDLKMQLDTQAQQDAHTEAELQMRKMASDLGINYDTIANHGAAVSDHLQAQTATNGAASIPAGTHVSADGENIYIPKNPDSPQTQDAQKELYSKLAPVLGLPALTPVSDVGKAVHLMTNLVQGFGLDGNPIKHDDLPGVIAAEKARRQSLVDSGATPDQLKTFDNMVNIHQANLDALDEHKQGVLDAASQRKQDEQTNQLQQKGEQQRLTNAAKPQKTDTAMYVGSDANGNQVAGTASDLQAAGASGVTKLDADTGKKVITARQLISPDGLFAQIKQDMLNLDAKGKMGSSATARLNDALLQKAGADPDYAPLFVHTHLLSTALMQAHVGSRGSSDMMEEFKSLANAGTMNAATLRSSLGAEYKYVKEKAMLPNKQQATGGQ